MVTKVGHPEAGVIGSSFRGILGAGSEEAEADAADFCGGALGEAFDIEGGALYGMPDFAIGWSAASAGSDGGSGFGDPTVLRWWRTRLRRRHR